jgi:ribosomal protein S18 acetylase RimI-like enzyme
MRITYQSALHLSFTALAEIHTEAYGGGWVSSPAKLADIARTLNLDLEHSLIAYDGRRPIGMALLGRRRAHGWLYDFAIIPAYRGQGLGTRLLTTTTREIAKAGVRDIELDVWEKRDDAIRIYGRVGFEQQRMYLIFEATGADLQLHDRDLPADWRFEACRAEELTEWYARSHSEPEPSWDRRLPSLFTIGDAQTRLLIDEHGPAACMYYAARPASGRDPNRIRPLFIGLRDGVSLPHVRAVFVAAAQDAFSDLQTTSFRVALEPETSSLARTLIDSGMRVVGRALDMRLRIT